MPINPETGETDRHTFTPEALYEYHVKQAKVLRVEIRKGKRCAHDLPEAEEQEGSEVAALLGLSSLASLKRLTLGGGKPSPGSTPADSLANLHQPPLPKQPILPSLAPKTHKHS